MRAEPSVQAHSAKEQKKRYYPLGTEATRASTRGGGMCSPGSGNSNDREGHHGSDKIGRRFGSAGSIPVGVRGARAWSTGDGAGGCPKGLEVWGKGLHVPGGFASGWWCYAATKKREGRSPWWSGSSEREEQSL
jgi:hypothetical protein